MYLNTARFYFQANQTKQKRQIKLCILYAANVKDDHLFRAVIQSEKLNSYILHENINFISCFGCMYTVDT